MHWQLVHSTAQQYSTVGSLNSVLYRTIRPVNFFFLAPLKVGAWRSPMALEKEPPAQLLVHRDETSL